MSTYKTDFSKEPFLAKMLVRTQNYSYTSNLLIIKSNNFGFIIGLFSFQLFTLLSSFFPHLLVSEHAAIDFQPTAWARTASTKTFCLHAQRLVGVEKK